MTAQVIPCKVQQKTAEILNAAAALQKQFRQLRQATYACHDCPASGECEILRNFQRSIQEALSAITKEWNLNE
ncbi:MAG: hypothetical protein ACOYYS_19310 [Chloroflexota bacterium]